MSYNRSSQTLYLSTYNIFEVSILFHHSEVTRSCQPPQIRYILEATISLGTTAVHTRCGHLIYMNTFFTFRPGITHTIQYNVDHGWFAVPNHNKQIEIDQCPPVFWNHVQEFHLCESSGQTTPNPTRSIRIIINWSINFTKLAIPQRQHPKLASLEDWV